MTVFEAACQGAGIGKPYAEYLFCEGRKWRLDYAWPEYMLALEVEGAVWTRGRHVRGAGFIKDLEKYNTAAILGWRVLRCTVDQFEDGTGLELVMRAVEASKV